MVICVQYAVTTHPGTHTAGLTSMIHLASHIHLFIRKWISLGRLQQCIAGIATKIRNHLRSISCSSEEQLLRWMYGWLKDGWWKGEMDGWIWNRWKMEDEWKVGGWRDGGRDGGRDGCPIPPHLSFGFGLRGCYYHNKWLNTHTHTHTHTHTLISNKCRFPPTKNNSLNSYLLFNQAKNW